jgi:hypothetical protein
MDKSNKSCYHYCAKGDGVVKKKYLIAIALLLIAATVLLLGRQVHMKDPKQGTVTYTYGDISFTDKMTAEELAAVARILDGKVYAMELGVPSCGFNEKIAIIVDGKTFMLACDKCGTVQCGMRFIHLSDAERDVLERIFTSRGGEFPCV